VGNPAGKMSKLITILTFLLLSCSTADKYDLFKVNTAHNFEFLDFEQINDIRTFNEKFWYADSVNNDFVFIAKFDFKKGDFSKTSDKGIKLEGFPFPCLALDCNRRYGLKLFVTDNYEIEYDDKKLSNEKEIKDLIRKNILNFGQDPSLSDDPQEAATELYLKPGQQLSKLGHLLKIIADGYLELINEKKMETKQSTAELIMEFPLSIHLRENNIPPYVPRTIIVPSDEEIQGEITLDSVLLNLK
jgi:hypothetical protein